MIRVKVDTSADLNLIKKYFVNINVNMSRRNTPQGETFGRWQLELRLLKTTVTMLGLIGPQWKTSSSV